MVYRQISLDMKQRALELIDKGWEAEDIAYALGVSSKSIARWADNYDTYGQRMIYTNFFVKTRHFSWTRSRNGWHCITTSRSRPQHFMTIFETSVSRLRSSEGLLQSVTKLLEQNGSLMLPPTIRKMSVSLLSLFIGCSALRSPRSLPKLWSLSMSIQHDKSGASTARISTGDDKDSSEEPYDMLNERVKRA